MKNFPHLADFVRPPWYTQRMQMMKVTTLMKTLVKFGDFGHDDWGHMINDKAADPGFMRLVEDIERDGIQMPINISWGTVRNGHHRLAAAILLALDEVPVSEWDEDMGEYAACWQYDVEGNAVSSTHVYAPIDLYDTDVVDSW